MEEEEREEEVQDFGFKNWRSRFRTFPEPVVFFYILALHVQIPLLEQYALVHYGREEGLNATSVLGKHSCDQELNNETAEFIHNEIRSKAASFQSKLVLFEAIPSVFFCLIYGPLSDLIGRKPILRLALFSSLIEALFILVTINQRLDLSTVFIGSFINGVGGFVTNVQMSYMAIIADTTDKNYRYFRLGVVHSFALFASLASSLISGILITKIGFLSTYYIVAGSYLIAAFYCAFVLEETRPPDIDGLKQFKIIHLLRFPLDAVLTLLKPTPQRWKAITMFFAQLFNYLVFMGSAPLYNFYALGEPFCLSPQLLGYFLATRFACVGLGTPFSLKVLRFLPDFGMAVVGIFSDAAGILALIVARTRIALFSAWLYTIASCVPGAIYRSILSNSVSESDQGKIFALVASAEILFVFIGNFSLNSFYSLGLEYDLPELALIIDLGILTIPLILTIFYGVRNQLSETKDSTDEKMLLMRANSEAKELR